MAFNGITWAGNIYQKFETMCLEVEEVMYEDTVKYVENQVQKVGVSVKKLYSEAIQDLLPPSCVDPVKFPGKLSLNPYSEADIKKKPRLNILDGNIEVNSKNTEDEVVYDFTSVRNDFLGDHLSPRNARVLVENIGPELCSARSKVGIHKRLGIKRISQNKCPAKVSSPVTSPASEKIESAESQRQKKENSECTSSVTDEKLSAEYWRLNMDGSDSPITDKTSSVEYGRLNMDGSDLPITDKSLSAKSIRLKMDNLECTSPALDAIEYAEINSSESVREKKYDSGCTSSSRSLPSESTSLNRNSVSKSSSSIRSNACEVEPVAEGIVTPDEGVSVKDGSLCQLDSKSDICHIEHAEVIENYEVAEPNLEGIEPVEKSKLDESCVFVQGDELHLDQWIKKHKSYKKKIREVLCSKLRSPRKQDNRNLAANESLESNWELL